MCPPRSQLTELLLQCSLKSIRGQRPAPARTAPRATTVAEGWPTGWGRVHGLATRERESTISACKPLFWGVCKIVSLLIDETLLTLDHFRHLPCNNMAPPIALSSASLLKSPPKNKSLFQPHRHLAADTASFEGALVSRQDADWQGEVEWPTAAPPRSPTHAKQGQNRGCSAIRSINMQLLTHHRFTLHFILAFRPDVSEWSQFINIFLFHRITIQFIVTKMTINCIDNFWTKIAETMERASYSWNARVKSRPRPPRDKHLASGKARNSFKELNQCKRTNIQYPLQLQGLRQKIARGCWSFLAARTCLLNFTFVAFAAFCQKKTALLRCCVVLQLINAE